MIRILANQYEKKLKDIALKEMSLFNKNQETESIDLNILLNTGCIPLFISKNKYSLIGAGVYSNVYRVLYKGKSAIAKISENKNEFNKSIELFNLKNKLGDLEKHILEIYGNEEYLNKKVLIVEELFPINIHLDNLFYMYKNQGALNNFKSYLKLLNRKINLLNEDFYLNFLNEDDYFKCKEYLLRFNNDLKFLIKNQLQILEKFNDENNTAVIFKITNLRLDFDSKILLFINELEKILSNIIDIKPISINIKFDSIFNNIKKILINEQYFPKSYYDYKINDKSFLSNLPEVESLMKCLLKLKSLGIEWDDLHSYNIMERKDHTLVISDPGLFI